MENVNANIWYDKGKLLSHNSILNFLIGQRGGGKTYGFKTWCVDDFLSTGRKFLWLRRYNTELKGHGKNMGVIDTWAKDIAHLYPKNEIVIKAGVCYIDKEIAGYFGALSVSAQWKSIPFNDVNKVIYDEFLIATGVGKIYLKNEPVIFLELMETVGRMRDDIRYILIGNALSFANPYFTYFNIKPFSKGFYRDKKRGITVELYNNDAFSEVKRATKLGRLVEGTDYADYAIENEFLLDNDKFIGSRTSTSKPLFNVKWDKHIIGIWVDYDTGLFYASSTVDKTRSIFVFKAEDHDVNMFMITRGKSMAFTKSLRIAFEYGQLMFENQMIKATMMNVLSKL